MRNHTRTLAFALLSIIAGCSASSDPSGNSEGFVPAASKEDGGKEDGALADDASAATENDSGATPESPDGGAVDPSADASAPPSEPTADASVPSDPKPPADSGAAPPPADTGSTATTDAGTKPDTKWSGSDSGTSNDAKADTHDSAPPAVDSAPPSPSDASVAVDSAPPPPPAVDASTPSTYVPTAADLLALTASCKVASTAKYSTDSGSTPTVDICSLPGAYFWKADMDIDCDGKTTTVCNSSTDPAFQPQTSFTDSKGGWLDASTLPYVVIPLPSSRFSYTSAGIQPGAVVAVIYGSKVVYGVFGDEGPSDIIGESSVAMANALGIPSNPASGGVDSGVTYIVFTGASAVPAKLEDHAAATTLGESLAAKLLGK